jgi:hypothetical protein
VPDDPLRPPPGKALPAPARSTAIPELGVAGGVHDDPGLAPALMTAQAQPTGTPAGQPTSPDQRAAEFTADTGGSETASAETLLIAAYMLMWAVLLGFLLMSWRRQRGIDDRIASLEGALTKSEKSAPADEP